MREITSFSGEYSFLSNFYPCRIEYDGIIYPSSEHAFQAAKTLSRGERRDIAALSTPGKAKRAGRHVTLRPNWDDIRVSVMEDILRIKFHDPVLRQKLLDTKNAILIEGNNWNDKFWGMVYYRPGNWHGENNLGRLLMKIRRGLTR